MRIGILKVVDAESGNISPWYCTTSRVWTADNPAPSYYGKCESATALSDMAEEVYRQTDRVIDEIQPRDVQHLDMYSIYQKLDADVPTYERAMEIAAEAKKEANIDGAAWLAEVQRLIQSQITET